MSVLVINRDLSELEYYHQANDLYKDMTQLLLRNFGIKTKKKELAISSTEKAAVIAAFPYMEEAFLRMDQLEAAATLREYSGWLINHYRQHILTRLESLLDNISDAYRSKGERRKAFRRKAFRRKALNDCEKLIQLLQRVMTVLPVDVNKLIPYVDRIDRIIELLKTQL